MLSSLTITPVKFMTFSPNELQQFERLYPLEAEAFRNDQPLPEELQDLEVRARYRKWRQIYKEAPEMALRSQNYLKRLEAEGKIPARPAAAQELQA